MRMGTNTPAAYVNARINTVITCLLSDLFICSVINMFTIFTHLTFIHCPKATWSLSLCHHSLATCSLWDAVTHSSYTVSLPLH